LSNSTSSSLISSSLAPRPHAQIKTNRKKHTNRFRRCSTQNSSLRTIKRPSWTNATKSSSFHSKTLQLTLEISISKKQEPIKAVNTQSMMSRLVSSFRSVRPSPNPVKASIKSFNPSAKRSRPKVSSCHSHHPSPHQAAGSRQPKPLLQSRQTQGLCRRRTLSL